jgi:hypothetical protein
MAVTVAGKNYTQISSCDTASSGGTWGGSPAVDSANKKEGVASLSDILKSSGNNDWTFTPTSSIDMSGIKHLRIWCIFTHGGLVELEVNDGIQLFISDGTNTGYYTVGGRDTYPGGWYNFVVDVSRTVDNGTKPTNMNAITSIGVRLVLTGAGKNADNTWVDNLCLCDGLTAYGDDGGGYFDFDNIFSADDASLGIGIVRKIGGQYFLTGNLEIGDGAGINSCKFQAKSQIAIFEDRLVNSNLYNITVVDNGTGTTEFVLGDKSGTEGIQGCTVRIADSAQNAKFDLDGSTDTDVDNFKLYASTFFGADTIAFPGAGPNVEVIGDSFELCGQINSDDAVTTGCFFINTSDVDSALLWNENINISSCTFIANTTGAAIEMPSAAGTPYAYNGLFFSGNTYDVLNSSSSGIEINKNNGSDPTTYEGSTVTFLGVSVTTQITVKDIGTTNPIIGARVLLWATDNANYFYQASVTITGTGTTATVVHTAHGLSTGDNVIIEGAVQDVYNGAYTVTVTGANAYIYTTNETITVSPATGTITSTFAFINEITNGSGIANDTRSLSSDQPIAGRVRMSSSSPYYQQQPITGTINKDNGLTLTIQLIRDE